MPTTNELKRLCSQTRRDIVRMVHAPASGHPGGSLGCTEFFVSLYHEIMKPDASSFTMDGTGEDLFFLSNGHISPVWYSVLARYGYFPIKELSTFRMLNTRLQGHPTTHEGLPGVRVASGSLGMGLSVGIGAATSKKLNGESKLVYTLHGDGELQEGQIWEAALYASAKKVDNIIAAVDVNGKQIDGSTDDVMAMGDLRAKFEAFGWKVFSCNGNDLDDLLKTMAACKTATGKGVPVINLMKTEMGMGVDYMMGTHKWHGVAPNDAQLELALAQLEETFGDY
jgi:transketolase